MQALYKLNNNHETTSYKSGSKMKSSETGKGRIALI